MEVQRYANLAPGGIQHMSYKDFTANGVTIPAKTLFFPQMTNLLKGDYWKEGTTFNPDRFLDSQGQAKKDEHLVPFMMGKYHHNHNQ